MNMNLVAGIASRAVNLAEPAQREPAVLNVAHTRVPGDSCIRPQGSNLRFHRGRERNRTAGLFRVKEEQRL